MKVWQIPEPIPKGLCSGSTRWCIAKREPFRFSRVDIPCEDDGKLARSEPCEFLAQARSHRSVARIEAGGAAQSARGLPAECHDANSGATGNPLADPIEELKHSTGGSPILCRAAPETACEESSFRVGRV